MKLTRALLIPVIAALLWIIVTELHLVSELFLPGPFAVIRSLFSLVVTGNVISDLLLTVGRVFVGFFSAVLIGVPVGAVMGLSNGVRKLMEPSIDVLRSIPTTAMLPLFMLLLGIGDKSIVALVAVPCLWTMIMNTMYGVANGSKARRDIARLYRASRLQTLVYVVIPDSLPFVVAGLRLGMALALHMAIAAEMIAGARVGLGRRLFDAEMLLRVPEMYALLLITGALGYTLNRGLVAFERAVVHWSGR